jgi:predicted PurR-regulated permease PerM
MVDMPPSGTSLPPAARVRSTLVAVAVLGFAAVALYFGRDIFIPFALAILLSFVLGPLATRLRHWVGRVAGVALAVLLAFIVIGGVAMAIGTQVVQLAQNLPLYQTTIREKVHALRADAADAGIFDRVLTLFQELDEELSSEPDPEPEAAPVEAVPVAPVAPGDPAVAPEAEPAPEPQHEGPQLVRIVERPSSPLELFGNVAVPLLAPVVTAGLVIVFVIVILLEREDMRDRFIRLAGGGNLPVTTEALDEAAKRVTRYLLMQLMVNAGSAVPIGIGLSIIGVPNALLWAVLALVLRFLPYVGPFLAALFPAVVAFAVDPGWSMLAWTLVIFITVEVITGNFIEPRLYGSSTGISTIAILLAAVFWTTLWGPVGLFLATPLTVCLAVMGRYIPQLEFLGVLLGSEPVFRPEERLYHRMLSGDTDAGDEIAKEELKTRSLTGFYEEVVLPALRLAERDRHRQGYSEERRAILVDAFRAVIRDLADFEEPEPPAVEDEEAGGVATAAAAVVTWTGDAVLCVGGRTGLDAIAAMMLAQTLARRGIGAVALPPEALLPEAVGELAGAREAELICLCYLGGSGVVRAQQVCRRLRRRGTDARLMVAFWNGQLDESKGKEQAAGLAADHVATSLAQAVADIVELATVPLDAPMLPAPTPADEAERLAALGALAILDTPPADGLDRIVVRLAKAFDMPIALVSLVDAERQFFLAHAGLQDDLAAARQAPRHTSICGHVVAAKQMIVVEDVLQDERFANNPFLRQRGIRFYAGAPLIAGGQAVGTVSVLDTRPRRITPRDRFLLETMADEVVDEIRRLNAAVVEAPSETVPATA